MKTVVSKKKVEIDITSYEAFDGTLFKTAAECEQYENEKRYEDLRRLIVSSEVLPLGIDANPDNDFTWYKITNQNDLEKLNNYFPTINALNIELPDVICVETDGYDTWYSTLKESFDITKSFWKEFGMNINFDIDLNKAIIKMKGID